MAEMAEIRDVWQEGEWPKWPECEVSLPILPIFRLASDGSSPLSARRGNRGPPLRGIAGPPFEYIPCGRRGRAVRYRQSLSKPVMSRHEFGGRYRIGLDGWKMGRGREWTTRDDGHEHPVIQHSRGKLPFAVSAPEGRRARTAQPESVSWVMTR